MSAATSVVRVTGASNTIEVLDVDLPALDIVLGPGCTLVGVDFIRDRVRVAVPIAASSGPALFDVFPTRGRASGGQRVVLSGSHLPTTATVRLGGVEAVVLQRSPQRIVVRTPPLAPGEHDVEVLALGASLLLPSTWRSLP